MTIESLKHLALDPDTPIILAHDYNSHHKFQQYLVNLRQYILDMPTVRIVVRNTHGHLTGNIRNAFEYITTDYVLILQHDLPFIRDIAIEKVIADMQNNPELKHVRFNKRANTAAGWDGLNKLFGKQVKSEEYIYTRTPAWSDQNHIVRSDYYRDIVLNECKDGGFMEATLHGKSRSEASHSLYGTYIFGALNDSAYIRHIDGRQMVTVPFK